jgi:hypothetical protein
MVVSTRIRTVVQRVPRGQRHVKHVCHAKLGRGSGDPSSDLRAEAVATMLRDPPPLLAYRDERGRNLLHIRCGVDAAKRKLRPRTPSAPLSFFRAGEAMG